MFKFKILHSPVSTTVLKIDPSTAWFAVNLQL